MNFFTRSFPCIEVGYSTLLIVHALSQLISTGTITNQTRNTRTHVSLLRKTKYELKIWCPILSSAIYYNYAQNRNNRVQEQRIPPFQDVSSPCTTSWADLERVCLKSSSQVLLQFFSYNIDLTHTSFASHVWVMPFAPYLHHSQLFENGFHRSKLTWKTQIKVNELKQWELVCSLFYLSSSSFIF